MVGSKKEFFQEVKHWKFSEHTLICELELNNQLHRELLCYYRISSQCHWESKESKTVQLNSQKLLAKSLYIKKPNKIQWNYSDRNIQRWILD